ncbi:hypothetical protein ACFUVV_18675 [Streptomyces sp. NPDC057376]|uniref:hypothetical protein n=1 Tax=unclassified Streptomyces TaxID=2593676 RepID=UPI00093E0BC5|nr:hypothetical protein [Streptomyces sp. CB02414]OKI88477.1 hypothetical protein AMK11_10010 [Streptomyces sp. CB02414]
MLDLTVRFLAWMLSICTPGPQGRHRLVEEPPLRFIPAPPPRFTEPLDGNASRLVRAYVPVPPNLRHPATFGIGVGVTVGQKYIPNPDNAYVQAATR